MQIQIIHLKERIDRIQLLEKQLIDQNIKDYKIWEGVLDKEHPKRGISKAHRQIVKWASSQNLPSVLVAEDDVKFTAKGAFEYFLKHRPVKFDLYLGGISYGNINPDNSVSDFAGLHLYMVHQNFYSLFLSSPEEENIDRSLSNKGKYIVSNPFVAIQQNGFSDNLKKYQNYELYIQNRKLFSKNSN